MKTYAVKASEIERSWWVVDATDQTLGRLATRVATLLEGKHKPSTRRTSIRATTSSSSTRRRSGVTSCGTTSGIRDIPAASARRASDG